MNRVCLYCNEPLSGRIDKKFCDDHCRNTYNNKLKRATTNEVRNVNNTLKRNHRILMKFNPSGKATSSKADLLTAGFNFDYFTSRYETKQGKVYHYVYDYGFSEYEPGKLVLVKKQEWMN